MNESTVFQLAEVPKDGGEQTEEACGRENSRIKRKVVIR